MIALASDCLLFQHANGHCFPCSAELKAAELQGPLADLFNADFVRHASHAVLYYFKHELGRQTVSVGEFAGALEKVLQGFVLTTKAAAGMTMGRELVETDLQMLAGEPGEGCELLFFPRLREALRQHLQAPPRVLHFRGLRGCVMRLQGVRRWTARCRRLEDQIVAYLRECLSVEASHSTVALIID